jgi:uncharacterized protein with HEPN domain
MSERPVKIILEDIIEAIDDALSFTEGMEIKEFLKDKKTQAASIRSIEIIGEAVNRLPDTLIARYTDIDWHKAVSMRNKLIHGYFDLDLAMVWNTIKNVLPGFKEQIKVLVEVS